ncbi:hypothetical protein [Streptomyces lincolnensis]|uniref:hypothetical protein n=1 Tax=Streptomyces lincolnensis TaxID=1915 RepID=UPI0037D42063
MSTDFEYTDDGQDLTIALAAGDAQALGDDAQLLAALFASALHGIALLRTGGAGADDLAAAIEGTSGLLERLKAARNAEVRQYDTQGGSHGALGKAMGVTRATAQSRRRLILKDPPGALEQWATGDTD